MSGTAHIQSKYPFWKQWAGWRFGNEENAFYARSSIAFRGFVCSYAFINDFTGNVTHSGWIWNEYALCACVCTNIFGYGSPSNWISNSLLSRHASAVAVARAHFANCCFINNEPKIKYHPTNRMNSNAFSIAKNMTVYIYPKQSKTKNTHQIREDCATHNMFYK